MTDFALRQVELTKLFYGGVTALAGTNCNLQSCTLKINEKKAVCRWEFCCFFPFYGTVTPKPSNVPYCDSPAYCYTPTFT